MATRRTLQMLEVPRVVPKGAVHVARLLETGVMALVAAGRLGIFTPMHFVLARKPG